MKKLLVLFLLPLLISCTTEADFVPETNQAQAYTIIKADSYPTPPNKEGLEVYIYSATATTMKKRSHTAMKAALDILRDKGLYEITVKLSASPDINKFNSLAHVQFNPYKKNTWGSDTEYVWDVMASDHQVVNGKIVDGDKTYPLDYLSLKPVLKQ